MANKELVDYLVEGKKRGFSSNLLKKKLLEARFEEKDIDEAIKESDAKDKEVVPVADEKVVGSDKKVKEKKVEFGKDGKMLKAEVLGAWKKFGKAFVHPKELFERTKGEGVGPAVKYLYAISIIPFLISSVLTVLLLPTIMRLLVEYFGPFFGTLSIVNSLSSISLTSIGIILGFYLVNYFVLVPIMFFILAGIFHFISLVYGGNFGYGETYGAVVYGSTPAIILSTIPFLNFATAIWSFILHVIGISIKQEISKIKSFFVLITPSLIVGFILLVIWVLGMFLN